jgi:FtsZ-binding cell division protein ZapB
MRLKQRLEELQEENNNLSALQQQMAREYEWTRSRNRSLQRRYQEFLLTMRPILTLLERAVGSFDGLRLSEGLSPNRLGEELDSPQCIAREDVDTFTKFPPETPDTTLPKPTIKWTDGLPDREARFVPLCEEAAAKRKRSAKRVPTGAKSSPRSLSATHATTRSSQGQQRRKSPKR